MATLAAAAPASAAGYYSGGPGARASGRAGAFTVRADDLSAAHYNPAGISRIGNMVHVGNKFYYNQHEYQRADQLNWRVDEGQPPMLLTFEKVENEVPFQPLGPLLGVSSNFGLDDWGFALVAYAPAGIARQQFPIDGGQRYMMVERNTMMINYTLNAAWQYDDVWGVGMGFQWIAVPELTYELVVNGAGSGEINPAFSFTDLHSRFQGSDMFTPNLVIGAWFALNPSWEIAVSGQVIPTQLELQGKLNAQSLNQEAIDQSNADLQPGEVPDTGAVAFLPTNEMELTLPLPLVARAGVRYIGRSDRRELFDLELNLVYETWSRVDRFRLDGRGISATFTGVTVEDIGALDVEKQWNDTLGIHLGSDVVVSDVLTLRAGAFYETAVAPNAYLNVDFPSGQQLGGAIGASLNLGAFEFAIAQEVRHQPTTSVTEAEGKVYQQVPGGRCVPPYTHPVQCNPQDPGQPSPTVNAGSYTATSWVTSLDVLYRF